MVWCPADISLHLILDARAFALLIIVYSHFGHGRKSKNSSARMRAVASLKAAQAYGVQSTDCWITSHCCAGQETDSQILSSHPLGLCELMQTLLYVLCVSGQSHDGAGLDSSICRCRHLSLVGSGLGCNVAAVHEAASTKALVMTSPSSLQKIIFAQKCARMSVLLGLARYRHARCRANRCCSVSLQTL